MVQIRELLATGRTVSFEFFPPKTPEGFDNLRGVLDELAHLEPSFVSVTYGAGGSTRDKTRDLVLEIDASRPFPAMPHLTCMLQTKDEVVALLDDYAAHGIENVLALGGDPPADGTPPGGDFKYALELVELARERGDFSIGVAAFPETHPRSPDRATDRRHLAAKLEASDFAITQFFFDAEHYRQMMDELDELGVRKPVIPGVFPPLNPATVRRFAGMNGSETPEPLLERIEAASEEEGFEMAIDCAVSLCHELLDMGAPGLHLYTLNRSEATKRIHAQLPR